MRVASSTVYDGMTCKVSKSTKKALRHSVVTLHNVVEWWISGGLLKVYDIDSTDYERKTVVFNLSSI